MVPIARRTFTTFSFEAYLSDRTFSLKQIMIREIRYERCYTDVTRPSPISSYCYSAVLYYVCTSFLPKRRIPLLPMDRLGDWPLPVLVPLFSVRFGPSKGGTDSSYHSESVGTTSSHFKAIFVHRSICHKKA